MSAAELESAAREVAGSRAALASSMAGLKQQALKTVRSPYVMGGVAASAALAGLMVAKKKASAQPRKNQRNKTVPGDSLTKWGQRLAPLVTAATAGKAASEPSKFPPPPPLALETHAAYAHSSEEAANEAQGREAGPPKGIVGRQWA